MNYKSRTVSYRQQDRNEADLVATDNRTDSYRQKDRNEGDLVATDNRTEMKEI